MLSILILIEFRMNFEKNEILVWIEYDQNIILIFDILYLES